MIEYILNNNANAKIFILGNYMCWNTNQGTSEPSAMDELIHDICDLYAIPFLDLLHCSNINIFNRDVVFADLQSSGMYLHLSNDSYEAISNMILSFIGTH